MRVVAQRVKHAAVHVNGSVVGEIGPGILAFVGAKQGDSAEDARALADKLLDLRIFSDPDGKMNLSLLDVKGSVLAVSQFTLYADCRKGRRPFFGLAEEPQKAQQLLNVFNEQVQKRGVELQTGEFGADMQVELCNDGPVTIILDSDELMKPR